MMVITPTLANDCAPIMFLAGGIKYHKFHMSRM